MRAFYAEHLAPGSAGRRKLAVQIVGRGHAGELAAPPPPGTKLVPDPQHLPAELPLWPAVLGDAHAPQ